AAVGIFRVAPADAADHAPSWTGPDYGPAFNQTWRDGNAELAAYALTYPRYGQVRTGTAAMVTVTEPFNPELRVKSDAGGPGTYGVLKLNLAEDFQTGLYDYNLMTSVFVNTEPAHGLPAGSAPKVSFSSQEWCGHVYQQAHFGHNRRGKLAVRQNSHSYFESEADQQRDLAHPAGGLAEEALVLWSRGLAGPALEPDQSMQLPIFRGAATQLLTHVDPAWVDATLSRLGETAVVTTPAGEFTCEVFTADVDGRRTTFWIDTAEGADRRLVKLERSDGYTLELLGVDRMPYWNLHGNADENRLESMGLKRRGDGVM
ncbi:MAG: hypothetical protein AAFX76_05260, partial [Planctomycetota bacterium]